MTVLHPMTPQQKLPKPTAIFLWLVFFCPVGLWLLWRDPRAPLRLKQGVTALLIIGLLIDGIYSVSPAGRAEQAAKDRTDAVAAAQQQKANAEQAAGQAKADQIKKAAQAKADAKEEIASQTEWERQRRLTQSSVATMRHDFLHGSNGDLIAAIEEGDDPYEVRVTVKNEWFYRVHQIQLQSAQNLWSEWAELRSPTDFGRAYIDIVDVNGNHVGGSTINDGAAVTVSES